MPRCAAAFDNVDICRHVQHTQLRMKILLSLLMMVFPISLCALRALENLYTMAGKLQVLMLGIRTSLALSRSATVVSSGTDAPHRALQPRRWLSAALAGDATSLAAESAASCRHGRVSRSIWSDAVMLCVLKIV